MKHYKAVIFDLDGVLCRTDGYHYRAWKQIADQLQIPFDEAVNNRLRGVSRMESLEIILSVAGRALPDAEKKALADQKNALYRGWLAHMTPDDLEPGAMDVLRALRSGGVKIAIGSSSKNSKYILERLGLADFFDAISDGTNITRSKPDPEVFQKAAQYLCADPKDCLVVEDAVAGVQAAHAAGMRCAAVGDAATHGIADYDLGSLADLPGIVSAPPLSAQ